MISRTKAGRKLTLITVCNYDRYQSPPTCQRDDSGTVPGRSRDIEEPSNQVTKKTVKQTSLLGPDPDVDWFIENAHGANTIKDHAALVRGLKVYADARGIDFRETVAALSAWAAANPSKAARRRNWGQFYVTCFKKQDPQVKPEEVKVDGWTQAERDAATRLNGG